MKIEHYVNSKRMRAEIEEGFGKKCKSFSPLCACCQAHHALEIFEDLLDDTWEKRTKNAKKLTSLQKKGSKEE